jgi:hypothetical protein
MDHKVIRRVLDSYDSEQDLVVGSFEHSNEP